MPSCDKHSFIEAVKVLKRWVRDCDVRIIQINVADELILRAFHPSDGTAEVRLPCSGQGAGVAWTFSPSTSLNRFAESPYDEILVDEDAQLLRCGTWSAKICNALMPIKEPDAIIATDAVRVEIPSQSLLPALAAVAHVDAHYLVDPGAVSVRLQSAKDGEVHIVTSDSYRIVCRVIRDCGPVPEVFLSWMMAKSLGKISKPSRAVTIINHCPEFEVLIPPYRFRGRHCCGMPKHFDALIHVADQAEVAFEADRIELLKVARDAASMKADSLVIVSGKRNTAALVDVAPTPRVVDIASAAGEGVLEASINPSFLAAALRNGTGPKVFVSSFQHELGFACLQLAFADGSFEVIAPKRVECEQTESELKKVRKYCHGKP